MAYRADIDGLRAIAVLSVIIFHAKLGLFPGGFVGVDVFFVISGYLIASIILKEEATKSFSLARFYERRIRRIFPALFVVILFSAAMGALLLTPNDYLLFGRSAFAAMAFWSNFYFSRQGGYFAPASETQPLLHTWSLGVEEQFYLLAPFILLLFARRLTRWRGPIFWSLFAASLAVSTWGVYAEEQWAFFLPHSRAFELMCGVALAMGLVPRAQGRANEALAAAGLAMIVFAVLFYSSATPFPGVAALLPAVGAALLIHTSSDTSRTLVARALSAAPFVYIGKISYSLYLWHWPLLAFAEYEFGDNLLAWHRVLLLLAAVAISALSYQFIEQPARRAAPPNARRIVFAAGAAALLITGGLSQFIVKGRGLPDRLEPEVAAIARNTPTRIGRAGACDVDSDRGGRSSQLDCFIGDQSAPAPTFLLWGDSHAAALAPGIAQIAKDAGAKGFNVGRGGCPPLLGLEAYPAFARRCGAAVNRALKALEDPNVREVVIVGRWAVYSEGVQMPHEGTRRRRMFAEDDFPANREIFAKLLAQTVERIAASGKRVTIIGPAPEFPMHVPTVVIRAAMKKQPAAVTMERAQFDKRQQNVLAALASIQANQPNIRMIFPHEFICDNTLCRGSLNGRALYVDDDHLSPTGAALLAPALRTIITSAK